MSLQLWLKFDLSWDDQLLALQLGPKFYHLVLTLEDIPESRLFGCFHYEALTPKQLRYVDINPLRIFISFA